MRMIRNTTSEPHSWEVRTGGSIGYVVGHVLQHVNDYGPDGYEARTINGAEVDPQANEAQTPGLGFADRYDAARALVERGDEPWCDPGGASRPAGRL